MKVNYHIHTSYSGDLLRENIAGETPEKYVRSAVQKGFGEICFTEHIVAGYPRTTPRHSHSMDVEKIPEYFREISLLMKKYPAVKIRIGAELDWLPEKLAEARNIISQYPFDCILGSVHIMDGAHVEHSDRTREGFWGRLTPEEIYLRHAAYYRAVQEMAKSGICDIVSHLDLVKRDARLPEKSVWPIILETIEVIAKNDLCVEVNTAGLRKQITEMHPTLEILKICRKKNIPVTIGTDAHRDSEIDFHLEDGMKMIKDAGYTEIAVFEKRKRKEVKI